MVFLPLTLYSNSTRYSMQENQNNSQNNQNWQQHIEENYPATGTRTNMQDIKIPTQQDIQRMENSKIILPNYNKVLNPL